MTHTSTITYLEMLSAPAKPSPPIPMQKIAVLRAHRPTLSFYRYLYGEVGRDWFWYERNIMADTKLSALLADDLVEIYVLYVGGVPAGYCELDRRHKNDIELAYFGLIPEFIGRGLGTYFLRWSIDMAWSYRPKKLWVHTCSEDHVNALPTYQKSGFEVYKQETIELNDPSILQWMDKKSKGSNECG